MKWVPPPDVVLPVPDDLCDGSGRRGDARPFHGCYRCCQACNLDTHTCPGCGQNLVHGIDICLRCRNKN